MSNLIIIGGGNSIRSFPTLFDDIVGHDVMTINYSYKFVKEPPKYQVSVDRLFWSKNVPEMTGLEIDGCYLVPMPQQQNITKKVSEATDDVFFVGQHKFSGFYGVNYATKKLKYDTIYLLGFDHGVVDGKTHFYDNIDHSGIGKTRAFVDCPGVTKNIIDDWDYLKDYNIKIVGDSKIKTFDKISYKSFLKGIKNDN